MDGDALFSSLLEQLKKIPKDWYLPMGIGGLGLIFLSIGLMQLLSPKTVTQDTSSPPVTAVVTPQASLTVDVEGAVEHPGVYHLKALSRVQEGLIAAGGLSSDADRVFVEQKMNLAAKLVDGGKVYIPKTGETAVSSGDTGGTSAVLGADTTQIDINSASAEVLDSLPGVGQVTAQKNYCRKTLRKC